MHEEPPHTFLFADLAGFTALTEAHGDEQAADLVDDFCGLARELLPQFGSEEIKAIGDALMLRSPDAGRGVALGLCLAQEIGGRHGFPGVRVGVHSGRAVERGNDWFGATVNLASRISTEAVAGEVLVTRATRDAARTDGAELHFRPLGVRRFKNMREPVEVYSALAASDAGGRSGRLMIDPVCRMSVDPALSAERRSHRGVEHHFCSRACAAAFDTDPDHHYG